MKLNVIPMALLLASTVAAINLRSLDKDDTPPGQSKANLSGLLKICKVWCPILLPNADGGDCTSICQSCFNQGVDNKKFEKCVCGYKALTKAAGSGTDFNVGQCINDPFWDDS